MSELEEYACAAWLHTRSGQRFTARDAYLDTELTIEKERDGTRLVHGTRHGVPYEHMHSYEATVWLLASMCSTAIISVQLEQGRWEALTYGIQDVPARRAYDEMMLTTEQLSLVHEVRRRQQP
jgi:hypothetical protein